MRYVVSKARGLGLALVMILAMLGVTAPVFAQDQGPWLVTEAQGDVWLKVPDGTTMPLRQGDEIGQGSVVGTGASGRATLSRAGTNMTLSPNGETEIPADSDQGARTTILQRLGALLLKVDKRPEQHFEVDTPFLAAVVKGTTFTVSVDSEGSAVHVVEGAVEVGAFGGGAVALVHPGQTARVASQPGSNLKVSGLGAPAGQSGDTGQQGQTGSGEESGQAAAGPADSQGGRQPAAAPAGKAKGLTLDQPVGWASIDIATVSDGFVAAMPASAANGLDQAVSAGGNPGGSSASNGNAIFGQSGGNGVTSAAVGTAAAANGAAAGAAASATSATVASSNGLGPIIKGAADAVDAINHGQAVSEVVHSLKANGNKSKGNGNN